MAFNYFNNQSYIGVANDTNNTSGISSLDSTRLNELPVGGAQFLNNFLNQELTYSWVVPAGVSSVCVVCVGGGGGGMWYNSNNSGYTYSMGGGGGGALAWLNDFPVTPGSTISIQVGKRGADHFNFNPGSNETGGHSWFHSTSTIIARGGDAGDYNNTTVSGGTRTVSTAYGTYGGGNGGSPIRTSSSGYGPAGGGGAGGYSGNGGNGRDDIASKGDDGSGGGGSGGGASSNATYVDHISGGGGGVGVFGEGSSGVGQTSGSGQGGSGGGTSNVPTNAANSQGGGGFGGGGGGKSSSYWGSYAGEGAPGTVRVIWGPGRAFPTTNVGEDYLGFNELSYFNPSAPPDP